MPHAHGRPPEQQPHRSISISVDGKIRFSNGQAVNITFHPGELRIGCHVVSREAWERINRAYVTYLGGDKAWTYQDGSGY